MQKVTLGVTQTVMMEASLIFLPYPDTGKINSKVIFNLVKLHGFICLRPIQEKLHSRKRLCRSTQPTIYKTNNKKTS